MSSLEKLLAEAPSESAKPAQTGTQGTESDWIDFGKIECKSGKFLVIDPAFAPDADSGVLIECLSGIYKIDAKVMTYGADRRVSRLRALRNGFQPTENLEQAGEAWSDVAAVGICDAIEFAKVFPTNEDAAENLMNNYLEKGASAGSLVVKGYKNTPLKYVGSGFGDGTFPVYKHVRDGETIGLEIEFIAADTPYPFGEKQEDTSAPPEKSLVQLLWNSEGLRQRLIKRRATMPLIEIKLTPFPESELTEAEAATLKVLEAAGYLRAGSFTSTLPNWRASYCLDLKTGIYAEVSLGGDQMRVDAGFDCVDSTSVFARDSAIKPGTPSGDWTRRIEMPGATPSELLEAITAEHKKYASRILRPKIEEIPRLQEKLFKRSQMWRAERGGWTREEIKLQLNKPDAKTEVVEGWYFELRDLWLFNWFRMNHTEPINVEICTKRLAIIHDDIPSGLLHYTWLWSTETIEPSGKKFEEGTPRECFARINVESGKPLRLVISKTSGCPADYYIKV